MHLPVGDAVLLQLDKATWLQQRDQMATRHIKRLLERQLQQSQTEKKIAEAEDSETDEEEDDHNTAKPFNPFDLLSDEEVRFVW